MKTALYGGTFNPVHKGHFNCLKTVLDSVDLDRVIVLPDRIPPHKASDGLVSGKDRMNMCRLAFEGLDKVSISDWELKQKGKSYSVITLRHFHKKYPGDKLFFIMGSDMLLSFEQWFEYKEILKLASLVCVSRENAVTQNDLKAHAQRLMKENGGEIIIVNTKPFEVSSTQIRDMIKKSADTSCYLDKNVVKYIEENELYMD